MKNPFFKRLLKASLILGCFLMTSCEESIREANNPHGVFGDYVLQSSSNSDTTETYSANLDYYLDPAKNTIAVAVGKCTDSAVTVPSKYNGLNVTAIYDSGFANDTQLTSIVLPSSIAAFGSQAFLNTSLTTLTIPAAVTTLPASCLMSCRKLTKVIFASRDSAIPFTAIGDFCFAGDVALDIMPFPKGLQTIGECAFEGCLVLPRAIFREGFTTVGAGAFMNCKSLGLAYFPSTISSIGDYAFKNCPLAKAYFSSKALPSGYLETTQNWNYVATTNATAAYVPVSLEKSTINYGSNFYYGKNDPDQGDKDYDIIIYLYNGTTTANLTIPSTLEDTDGTHKVVGIDVNAVKDHTELTSVTFGANLQFINANAFSGDNNLTAINFDAATDLTTIGDYAFYSSAVTNYSGITSLTIPSSVVTIGAHAFENYGYVTDLSFAGVSDGTAHLTSIGDKAFALLGSSSANHSLSLTLPGTLTSIGANAFLGSSIIKSLTFGDPSVATTLEVGDSAFKDLFFLVSLNFSSSKNATWKNATVDKVVATNTFALTYVYDPNGHNVVLGALIDDHTFLHSVYLPTSVQLMGGNSFANRARLSLYLAATSISGWANGWNTFAYTSFGDFSVAASGRDFIPTYYGVSSTGKKLIPYYWNSTTEVGSTVSSTGATQLFDFVETATGSNRVVCSRYYYDGLTTADLTPEIPSSFTYNSVTYSVIEVGKGAFCFSSLKGSSKISDTFTIASGDNSEMTSVVIPDAVTTIDDYAFFGCGPLSTVSDGTAGHFPTSLTKLGFFSFAYSGITAAYLPGGLSSIGETAATGAVGSSPFLGCFKLTTLQVNSNLTTAGQNYYTSDNVLYKSGSNSTYQEMITMASGTTYSAENNTCTIPNGCTTIDSRAFRGQRQVQKIKFPYSLTSIGEYFIDSIGSAYDQTGTGYNDLQSVRFYSTGSTYTSAQCSSIGQIAFWGCKNLTTCELPAKLTSIGNQAFYNCNKLAYFPTNSTDAGTKGVLDFSTLTNLTMLGNQAFQGCSQISELTLSSNLSSTGTNTFNGCSGLTSVTLQSGLTTIGGGAFQNCNNSAFTTISIPNTVTSIGDSAFKKDTGLTTVTLSSGLTAIKNNAFDGCSSITNITFPAGSSDCTVSQLAFSSCSKLTQIVIPSNVKFSFSGTNYPFLNCSSLTGIYLDITGTTYNTRGTSYYPLRFNYKNTSTTGNTIPIYCHDASSSTASGASGIGSWHYDNGVVTIGVGADS